MTDEDFWNLLARRGYSHEEIKPLKRGAGDIVFHTGRRLGDSMKEYPCLNSLSPLGRSLPYVSLVGIGAASRLAVKRRPLDQQQF